MKNKITIVRIKNATLVINIAFVLTLCAWGVYTYLSCLRAQQASEESQSHLGKLKKDIYEITTSMERYKKEKEEFGRLLFQEMDVPAFLDGISRFAEESFVNVVDMRTQKFAAVEIPKEVLAGMSDLDKKLIGDKKEQKETNQEKIKEIATLAAMPIRINVKGTYEAIVNFLVYLEGYKQLLTLSNVEIVSGREYPTLDCGFTLRLYSLKTLGELNQ